MTENKSNGSKQVPLVWFLSTGLTCLIGLAGMWITMERKITSIIVVHELWIEDIKELKGDVREIKAQQSEILQKLGAMEARDEVERRQDDDDRRQRDKR